MGNDYVPGNKCGLSTAGMKMLSGMTVACELEDASGTATTPNNVFMCAHYTPFVCVCVCGHMQRLYLLSNVITT